MQTVLSYIIQKRYSQEYENIATDVLAFILKSNESARNGMMKFLRGIISDLPDLHFETQQTEGVIRPDMWGMHESDSRVYIENKFWAGLTENQPVNYLTQLAKCPQPSLLLVVGPEARMHTLWRILMDRLKGAEIPFTDSDDRPGIINSVATGIGPIFTLTSWSRLLSALEFEVADDQGARSDILQLRSLCEAADIKAFIPISSTEITDQRTPAFILQLNTIVQVSVDMAVAENVLSHKGLAWGGRMDRVGRYARFSSEQGAGFWFGTSFPLWREHGGTPLWLVFDRTEFGRAHEVRPLLEPWAAREGIFTAWDDNEFVVAIDIETGEEKDRVIKGIVDRFRKISVVLSDLESAS